jgi:ATP-dependent protease ClpP protease subunit
MKTWFRMEVSAAAPTVADIYVYDIIGGWIDDLYASWGYDPGTTAKTFLEQLSKLDESVKTINVHINSPGGDCFSAAAIANALRAESAKGRAVRAFVDGLAASAASVIMMGADTITIADNGLVMIHNPWSIAIGNAAEMRKAAAELDKVRDSIVAAYQWHSKLSSEEIIALMDADTWMTADEAIANGFGTAKVESLKAAALISPEAMKTLTVPDQFKDRVNAFLAQAPAPPAPAKPAPVAASALEVIRACNAEGCSDLAEGLVSSNATLEQVNAKVAEVKAQRQAEASRVTDIRALCKTANCDDLADSYIRGGMPANEVRAQLAIVTGKIDHKEIDGSLPAGNGGSRRSAALNTADIYAARNGRPTAKE